MGAEIDRLELQVEAQATKANNQLDKLVGKLDALSSSLSHLNSSGLTGLSNGVAKFAQASAQLSNVKTADFTRLTKNIQSLASLNTQQIYGAASAMRTLSTAINSLGSVSASSMQVAEVAKSISKLGGVNVQRAITNLPALASALNNLMATLSKAPSVSSNIIQMTRALADLASQGAKVGTAGTSLARSVYGVGTAMSATTKKARSLASVFGSIYQKYFWIMRGANKLWDSIKNSMNYVEVLNYFDAAFGQVAESAVSQWGDAGYSSAEAYYESFSSRAKELTSKMTGFTVNDDGTLSATGEASLGINPSKLMNYQATFAQMSSSMGVASETSLMLSQALTEIGADLASVKNMDFDKVWKDMASGLAGMSRTLDKYGVNIRNVNLQQKLFDLGIEENIANLNQNDKALLRAIILLDSTKYAWGDLADTLNQPANQLRLLESNFSNLSRTIGNLFLPAVSKVLPYVNGLVIGLQRLFTWVGNLLGIDLSGITSSVGDSAVDIGDLLGETDDLTDSLTDAGNAAKKLKSNLQSFDELNVITTQTDSASSLSGAGLPSGLLDDAFANAFSEYQKVWDEAFANMENRANEFADKVEKFLQPVRDIIEDFAIGDFFKAGQDTSNLVAGIFNFFARAIDNVDWYGIGENIGNFIKGIDWLKILSSVGNFLDSIMDAAINLWSGSFDANPIATTIVTALGIAHFTGLDKVLTSKIIASVPKSIFLGAIAISFAPQIAQLTGKILGIDKTIFGDPIDDLSWSYFFKKLGDGFTDENGKFSITKGVSFTLEVIEADIKGTVDLLGLNDTNNPLLKFLFSPTDTIDLGVKLDNMWSNISQFFTREKWEELGENAKAGLQSKWIEFTNLWNDTNMPDWWDDVAPWFSEEKWGEFGDNVKNSLSGKWEEFTDLWENTLFYKWWNDVEKHFDKDAWTWDGIKEGLSQSWENAIEAVKSIWNRFADWLNEKLNFSWDSTTIMGKEIIPSGSINLGKIPTFKLGGFPEDGWFRASKGEYFGQFDDGTSYIANNNQIVDGVAEGVEEAAYRGMMRALSESGGSNVKIQVEGDPRGMFRVWKEEYESEANRLQKNPVIIY